MSKERGGSEKREKRFVVAGRLVLEDTGKMASDGIRKLYLDPETGVCFDLLPSNVIPIGDKRDRRKK